MRFGRVHCLAKRELLSTSLPLGSDYRSLNVEIALSIPQLDHFGCTFAQDLDFDGRNASPSRERGTYRSWRYHRPRINNDTIFDDTELANLAIVAYFHVGADLNSLGHTVVANVDVVANSNGIVVFLGLVFARWFHSHLRRDDAVTSNCDDWSGASWSLEVASNLGSVIYHGLAS